MFDAMVQVKGGMVRNRAGRYCVAPGEVRVGRLTEPSDSPQLAMPLPRIRHPMSKKRQGYLPSVSRLIVTASSERKVADATPPLANDGFIDGAAIELGHSGGAAMGGPRAWAAQGFYRYQLVRPCLLRRRSGILQRDLMVTCPARLQCWIECTVVDVTGAVGGRSRRLRRLNSVEFS